MKSIVSPPCSTPLWTVEAKSGRFPSLGPKRLSVLICSSRQRGIVPERDPFTPSYWERHIRAPTFVEKTRKEIADYCLTLEGDECSSCWKAYFELGQLQKEWQPSDVERLLLLDGGLNSVIGRLHRASTMTKPSPVASSRGPIPSFSTVEDEGSRRCPIPDGLPKTREELEEEENARMPDTPHTRLLRAKGKYPAWYTPLPDHETD